MTTPLLEDLADRHFTHAVHTHTTWQTGTRCIQDRGVLLHQGSLPLPIPFQNCAIRLDPTVPPAQVVDQAQAFYGGSANPYAILTFSRRDADLQTHLAEQGFHLQSDSPAMLAVAPVATVPLPESWHLRVAQDAADIADFVQVSASAYESMGLPAFMTPSYFSQPQALLQDTVSIVLAQADGAPAPAAAALVIHTAQLGDVAGVYWVGTQPSARGLHLASACTALATNLAFERGARAVTLQASPMGESVYPRLGYQTYARLQRWSR